ncbi:putative quinol monooxygenase [Membranihabitans marinus]|uniref:putative quinol monooxygenase n=1 Tax=Membranihabitans marinus TaxID=1227546 RepID=UPI001F16CEB2|nr:antibiotic biosynthesis monooxygenase [Membranihabitans marinus]
MKYGLHGKLSALPGKGQDLANILLEAATMVANAPGCQLYVVSTDTELDDTVWVTEVWDSKENHDKSLNVPGVRELIGQAMPLLDGMPEKGHEFNVIGGHGLKG